jgi:diguanylate cyclase (GGDEF)-like protein
VPVDLGRTLESVSQIRLGYRDDVVAFRFAALDFTAPAANRYAYMLEGFDKEWVQAGTARQATYTNLSGGNYVFRVRGANSDGTWSEQGLAIPVVTEAPPWARWWAFVTYGAAFLLALFSVWVAQQRRFQREAAYTRRLAAEVDARTEELAQRNKDLERANRQLEDASVTDLLTGLGNRRFLRTAVEKIFAEGAIAGVERAAPFVLIMVDLDNLKPINDQHGHDAGDRVLIQVAEILKSLCRTSDFIVRWGGDEFVMLCRGADLNSAAVLAERIRSTIAKKIFRIQEGLVARTSCSIGFAPFPFIAESPDSFTWEQTLAFADAALYRAKRDRNDWLGWGGTALAAELLQMQRSIETDSDALIRQGALSVRRRALASEDTVDQLRTLARGEKPGDAG